MLGDVNCGPFTLSTTQIADFIAGFVAGFSGHNDKYMIEACFMHDQSLEKDICNMVKDFESGDHRSVI